MIATAFLLLRASILFATTAGPFGRAGLEFDHKEGTLRASVKETYHVSKESPNRLTFDGKNFYPNTVEKGRITFSNLPSQWEKGRLIIYVCDDAITFCKPNFIDLKTLKTEAPSNPIQSPNKKFGLTNSHGFIEDDLLQALELAKRQNKFILVNFTTRWCLGCIRYENEIITTKDFMELSSDYIKVKIDLDRFENQVLSKKFSIDIIPTLLVINSSQQEIDRLIDFQPLAGLSHFLKEIESFPSTIDSLKMVADTTPIVHTTLIHRLIKSGQFEESLKYLKQDDPNYSYAQIKLAFQKYKQGNKYKEDCIRALKDALNNEDSSLRSLSWRTKLINLTEDRSEIAKLMTDGTRLADDLLKAPEKLQLAIANNGVGEYSNFERLMVAVQRAELIEAGSKTPSLIKSAWELAARVGEETQITPKNFGPSLRYLAVLMKAKKYKEADTLSRALIKKQPNNTDMQRRRLKVLIELKKYNEAIEIGKIALKNSYGRNEYWVVEPLTKAYIANKNYKEASALMNQYLVREDVDWASLQTIRKSLEELKETLEL